MSLDEQREAMYHRLPADWYYNTHSRVLLVPRSAASAPEHQESIRFWEDFAVVKYYDE